jgi:hypothetical protein
MAAYSRREVTTKRVEYVLPSPTNWAEVSKAMSAVTQDLRARGVGESDDAVWVKASDDEIVFWFEVEP